MRRICTTRLTRLGALRGLAIGAAAALAGTGLVPDEAGAKKKRSAKKGSKKGAAKNGGQRGRRQRTARLRAEAVACSQPSSVEPVDGNPPLCPGGLRINSPERTCQTITAPCGCKIEWCVTLGENGEELSFGPVDGVPACTVERVVVKGGNEGANIYTFDPAAFCAEGLTTPTDQEISHFDFCGIACCVPLTCEDVGCTDGPVSDGCTGEIDCPCPTNCENGDDGPNNTCDTGEGICVCTKDTCNDVAAECGTGFDDGCCGTFDCDCPTDCPAGTDDGPNNTCDGGTCVCDKNTCADLPSAVECGKNFDDGCCGSFDCNCPKDCPPNSDDGPNNTCTDEGVCVCTADTCASEGLACTSEPQDDGCCGAFSCPCPTDCPAGTDDGPNNRCTDAGCVCTKNTCQSLGVTCGIHDDGCCGQIDCGPCPEECSSCTIGYYSQNQCRVDTSVALPCGADSPIGKKCFEKYGSTVKKLLTARGGDVICAQAAAAYLNQVEFGQDSCTKAVDVCQADNETLSAANERGDCPLKGCGNDKDDKDNKKKKKKR